jgi:hypothetical protein
MTKYKNFDIAIYFSTRCLASITTIEEFEKEFSFLEKHLSISKVYLETHRDDMDVSADLLRSVKGFFESKGIKVSGGITPTLFKSQKNKPLIDETGIFGCGGTVIGKNAQALPLPEKGIKKAWSTFCFTDQASRQKFKEISEFTASIFDEFILDDFYFTTCTCESCIKEKGDRSWEQFRLDLMAEVSKSLVIEPAKKVNPNCNVIIKYPNWIEAYQETGYNTEIEPLLFDEIYTGTETRDTNHTIQHLPRYGSYSLMRWMENVKPGKNGGGWIDPGQGIQNLAYYLEQAYLTYFAKARELMLFCYSWIVDTVFVPPLGFELEKLDQVLGQTGNPVGIPVYEPHHAHGEDHLYDYLGMAGLAFEPQPFFPETDSLIMLTANSARDEQVLEKMKAHLIKGADVCITSGFLEAMQGKGIEEFTSALYTDKKAVTRDYMISGFGSVFTGEYYGRDDVLFPVIKYSNNAADCLVAARKNDNNFPVLLRNCYANGTVYTLTVPDDYADFYKYPTEVLTTIRQYLMSSLGLYIEGVDNIGIFMYDNATFIVESFRDSDSKIRLHIATGTKKLIDVRSGHELVPLLRKDDESIYEVSLKPVLYKVFKLV